MGADGQLGLGARPDAREEDDRGVRDRPEYRQDDRALRAGAAHGSRLRAGGDPKKHVKARESTCNTAHGRAPLATSGVPALRAPHASARTTIGAQASSLSISSAPSPIMSAPMPRT